MRHVSKHYASVHGDLYLCTNGVYIGVRLIPPASFEIEPGTHHSCMHEICPCGHSKIDLHPIILGCTYDAGNINFHTCMNSVYQALFHPIEPVGRS